MKTDLFQSHGHCWVFQICWHIECSTFTASSFRIWNSLTGIPSPPLALFIVMLSKAHLTSHSRLSGSRWVITPLWLSGSWRSGTGVSHRISAPDRGIIKSKILGYKKKFIRCYQYRNWSIQSWYKWSKWGSWFWDVFLPLKLGIKKFLLQAMCFQLKLNPGSVPWHWIKSHRQNFGWSRKEWLHCFARQRGPCLLRPAKQCVPTHSSFWGIL